MANHKKTPKPGALAWGFPCERSSRLERSDYVDESINRGKIAVRRSVVFVLRRFILLLNEYYTAKVAPDERFVAYPGITGDGMSGVDLGM